MTEIDLLVARAVLPDGMGADSAGFPRTTAHFEGETRLERPPRRIATISTGQLDQALSLGLVPVASTHNNSGELLPAYVADVPALPVDLGLRTDPDLDLLAHVAPDLIVVTKRGKAVRHLGRYREIAPTVVTEGKGFNWKQDYVLLAAALGREADAREVMATYDASCAELRALFATSPVCTVSLVRFGPTDMETFGRRSFAGSILTDAGLARPVGQDGPTNGRALGDGEVGEMAADLALHATADLAHAQARSREVRASEAWQRAVGGAGGHAVDHSAWFGHAGPLAALRVVQQLRDVIEGKEGV